ncbi:MAG: phosphorylase, partial [Proteobacteria bacterium]|nr:phosphorylase [Pseudomonadota bacterium]
MSCIGIISALSAEASCLADKTIPANTPVQINDHAIAMVCGMGEENARTAAQMLIEQNVSALVSWGTAGALSENVHTGDLILADSVVTKEEESYLFDTEWNKRVANKLCNTSLKIRNGMIAHADQVLVTTENKSRLQSVTHAVAVDMESISVARCADAANLPCMAVRAI